jgi:hypothetical protein
MTEKTKNIEELSPAEAVIANQYVSQDLKHSILIVSVVANLFVLTAWIALQVTAQFDSQLANFLFNR